MREIHLRTNLKMEGKFIQSTLTGSDEEADLLNDETFGLDVSELNNDWELNHEKLSKLLELEHEQVTKSSPLRIQKKTHENAPYFGELPSDEEEEVIIENSISQLGLDDDDDDISVTRNSGKSFEFKESMESWMSPSRGKDSFTDSLKELISPGEGVWSSPNRDQIVPEIGKREQEGNILKMFFGGHNIVTAKKSGEKLPTPQVINVEDLERGLAKESPIDHGILHERHQTPTPPLVPSTPPPPPGLVRPMLGPDIARMPLGAQLNMSSMMRPDISSLLLLNQQLSRLPPSLISLPIVPQMMPVRSPLPNMKERRSSEQQRYHSGSRGKQRGGRYNSSRYQYHRNRQDNSNGRYEDYRRKRNDPPDPPLVQMESSKMMTSKEKEWIFKISVMSLLNGDFYTSDYYFINYMNKKMLEMSSPNKDTDKQREDKEKAKNLVSYAQKHQQSKESYKPVKFEGSLGKLSITSVHHPRQLMDLSTPEKETQTMSRVQEGGRKRYAMYGMVEKMYDIVLRVNDQEKELVESHPDQREEILDKRTEQIDQLFEMFKVKLHTSQDEKSDTDHFLHMMSIGKARKLLQRSLNVFSQEQSESIIISIIHVLPALLKKDNKEKALRNLPNRMAITLSKSSEKFRIRCLQMLRKINLKMLLTYQMSIGILTVVLDSLTDKNPEHNIEWSYYFCEVPKVSIGLPPEIFQRNQDEIVQLREVLGVGELLINID